QNEFGRSPDGIGDDMRQRMARRRLRSDLALVDELLDIALVAAHLPDLASAHQVEAAVARPQTAAAAPPNEKNYHCAGDYGPRVDRSGHCPQVTVNFGKTGSDILGQCEAGLRRRHLIERGDDPTARVIAALVAAGSVGDRPQPDIGPLEDRVFVSPANRTGVGPHCGTIGNPLFDPGHDASVCAKLSLLSHVLDREPEQFRIWRPARGGRPFDLVRLEYAPPVQDKIFPKFRTSRALV